MTEVNQDPQDPFATTPAEDPFASVALADEVSAVEPEPEVEREADIQTGLEPAPTVEPEEIPSSAAVGIPTVDAEGNVIDPGEGAVEPPQEPQAAIPAEEPPATPPVAPAPPQEPPAPPQAAPVTPATSDGTRPVGPRGGKGEMRYYKLLYQSGPGTFTNFDLATVPNDIGVTVCKYAPPKEKEELAGKEAALASASGEKLAKLQADVKALRALHEELWFEARNNEHANRLGFAIMGRPKQGVKIFPVPRGAWKPKFVKPAPPAPARERVVIT